MSRQQNDEQYVKPAQVVSGIEGIEWLCQSEKSIDGQQYAGDLFGHLNPLRSFCITLVSDNEIEWIYSHSEQSLSHSPALDRQNVVVVILCDNCRSNPALTSICERHDIGLARTGCSDSQVLHYLRAELPKRVALRSTHHGVFIAVMNTGILVMGASGVGKSEVAMDLVQRGHQLIADDVVEIYRSEQSQLIGECPGLLRGYIEIRGLGIINVLNMFGPSAVLDSYRLQLIIDLQDSTNAEIQKIDRLSPSLGHRDILGIAVPCLTMLVAPGRNLSVLIEAAVRNHLLRCAGVEDSREFLQRHHEIMHHTANR